MKKLKILVAFLILGVVIIAQPYNQQDIVSTNTMNSSVTALDSAEVFTGKAEAVLYTSSITVLIRSDVSGTGSAQFSSDGTNWDLKEPFTYTASDSLAKYLFTVTGKYFRLIYTNSGTDQTYFRLQTIYHKTMISPLTDNRLDFNLPPAAADTTHQDQIIEAIDTTNARVSLLHGVLQNVEDRQAILQDSINVLNATQLVLEGLTEDLIEDADTANARLSVVSALLQGIEDRQAILQDSLNVLNATQLAIKGLLTLSNTKLDSILANNMEANGLLQQLDNNTDGLEAGTDSLKNDTELMRALLSSLNGKDFATDEKLDSLKNDTELIRTLISTLNGLIATDGGLDSLKNDTELLRALIVELRTSLQTIDNVVSGSEVQADIVTLPSITYGQSEIVNQLLDDDPVSVTSAGFEIGDKQKVSFILVYDETEVGGVSGDLTLEVSPDNTNWYALNAFYNNAGTIVSTVNYTADATDTFHLPEFVTYPYVRAVFTGTGTDADDTIQINITICWQGE